jgi:hypothetical protein
MTVPPECVAVHVNGSGGGGGVADGDGGTYIGTGGAPSEFAVVCEDAY